MNKVNIVLSIVLLLNVLALMYTIYMTISDKKEMLKGDYIYIGDVSISARNTILDIVVFDKHTLAWMVDLYGDTGKNIVKQTYADFKEGYTPSEDDNEDYGYDYNYNYDYSYEGDNE